MFAGRNTYNTFEWKLLKCAEALSTISKFLKGMLFPQQYFSASWTKQFFNQSWETAVMIQVFEFMCDNWEDSLALLFSDFQNCCVNKIRFELVTLVCATRKHSCFKSCLFVFFLWKCRSYRAFLFFRVIQLHPRYRFAVPCNHVHLQLFCYHCICTCSIITQIHMMKICTCIESVQPPTTRHCVSTGWRTNSWHVEIYYKKKWICSRCM